MFNPVLVLCILVPYLAVLLGVALWVEKRSAATATSGRSAVIYSLALAVYCTAWTFYGSVGRATGSGFQFLAIYLGPTLVIVLWGSLLRRMIRIKNRFHIISLPDLISARYDKSIALGIVATLVAIIGGLPYISLQIKAILTTFMIITAGASATAWIGYAGPIMVAIIALFTILVGIRRLDPTERHPGIMASLALECVVKLAAFLAVGVLATYVLHNGLGDVFQRAAALPSMPAASAGASTINWLTSLVLAMSAILFLPRQFHVAVVENSNEDHVRTARWMFPLYMLLINLFVVPIAMSGLLQGHSPAIADTFVLRLPLDAGWRFIGLLVFIGGFSAAAGMIMVDALAIATMVSNNLLLPVFDRFEVMAPLKRNLLRWRWAAVAAYIAAGYVFAVKVTASYMLVSIGMISFAAILQLAPATLGGLFWLKGNRHGAIGGIVAGFVVWFYTLLLPTFAKSWWHDIPFMDYGPFGLAFLRPEHLLWTTGLDPLPHGVFWSMLINVGFYLLGSVAFEQSETERAIAEEFARAGGERAATLSGSRAEGAPGDIDLADKVRIATALLSQYVDPEEAKRVAGDCLRESGIDGQRMISVLQLSDLANVLEKHLSGLLGAAMASKALQHGGLVTAVDSRRLEEAYGELAAELKLTPEALIAKVNEYRVREGMSAQHTAELEQRVQERTEALVQADKMAAVGQLASGVAHEINNPLGVILGFSQALVRKVSDGDPMAMPLKSIEREAKRCKILVMDLLTFSRTGRSEKSECLLNPIVDASLNIVAGKARSKSIGVVKELEDGQPPISLNSQKIQQVVINLCNNAIDAMSEGGRLVVGTARVDDCLVIRVQDTGPGIPPDPFFTTKPVGQGTGLGLALVYEIVRNHGGRIEVDSEPGQGARFSVLLPLAREEAAHERVVTAA